MARLLAAIGPGSLAVPIYVSSYYCVGVLILQLAGLPAAIGPGSLAALHSTLFLPLHSDASGYVCV
jgi:hypothetical protein